MGKNLQRQGGSTDLACRRRAERIPLPVEVQLTGSGRTVKGVIRDVCFEEELTTRSVGICILHNEALPLDETLDCRAMSVSERLPVESKVSLIWTRVFGNDGYLSGGTMLGMIGTQSPEGSES